MAKPHQRARYEKSILGCKTCKIRRVKCDETKPECLKCIRTGRRCEGPSVKNFTFVADSTVQLTRPVPEVVISPARVLTINRPTAESQAFSCFVNKAAPVLTGQHDIGLWGHLIPQVAQSNHVVWYTLLAIGSLWGLPTSTTVQEDGPFVPNIVATRQQAFQWYARALSDQRALGSSSDTAERLLTCIIFCNFEFQMQNLKGGLRMLRIGFKLLAPLTMSAHRPRGDSLMDALMNMYLRHACSISTSKLPTVPESFEGQDLLDPGAPLFRLLLTVYGLIKDVYFAVLQPDMGSSVLLTARRTHIIRQLDRWHHVNVSFLVTQSNGSSCSAELLCAYHEVVRSWLETTVILYDPLTSANEYAASLVSQAQRIVDAHIDHTTLESPAHYFFDVSILPPLYFVLMMSNDQRTKDRALVLMRQRTSQKTGEQDHTIVLTQRRKDTRFRMHWVQISQTEEGKRSSIVRYADVDD